MPATTIDVEGWRLREASTSLFLRIGRNFGSSRCGLDYEWRAETGQRYECGTSVYFLRRHADSYMVEEPRQELAVYQLKNYFSSMFTDVLVAPICKGEIYIVQGKLIPIVDHADSAYEWAVDQILDDAMAEARDRDEDDYEARYRMERAIKNGQVRVRALTYTSGSDGEPLLKANSARIVKTLTLEEFLGLYLNTSYRVGDLMYKRKPLWTLLTGQGDYDDLCGDYERAEE